MTTAVVDSFERLREYYSELHRFGVRLAEAASKFQQLTRTGRWPKPEVAPVYDRNDPNDILNRSIDITREFEFLVAVTGAFSSGKSSILNVLLNRPDLLPVSAIPLTAVCTVIRYGEVPRAEIRYVTLDEAFERIKAFIEKPFIKEFHRADQIEEALDRPENFIEDEQARESLRRFAGLLARYDRITKHSISFEERSPYISGGGVVPVGTESGGKFRYFVPTPGQEQEYLAAGGDPDLWVTKEWLALVRDVTLWVDSPLLHNNIVFMDLPGLNCREDYHRRAIQKYCNMADCVVVTAFQPGNQADEDIVQNFKRLSSNFREKLFFIFNRIDQFSTEPEELVRSFDYLSRDCIGRDFPKDRCFLTSAYFARERMRGSGKFDDEFGRFAGSFEEFQSPTPALEELVQRATTRDDPGGIGHLRGCLQGFLTEDAYRTKIEEILANYESVLERLRHAASPHYEDYLRMDPKDLLLRSALEYFRNIEQAAKGAFYKFRYDYLRGSSGPSSAVSADLKHVLERAHQQIERTIVSYFNQPIATAPPREDPVREFDLRRIADDASNQLRREFQENVTSAVVDAVRRRFYDCLNQCKLRDHVRNLFRGSPEMSETLDRILERYEFALRHSVLCKIRGKFYSMPGGRDLRRLEQKVDISQMKPLLVKVFSEFYPNWIFQNVYGEIQDGLWLSFFLDTEDLELELKKFFEICQGHITSSDVLEKVRVPDDLSEGFSDIFEAAGVCKQIEELIRQKEALRSRNSSYSLANQV